ncbi:MAG: hypothetical protein WBG43_05565 [Marinifilaceae bacterium]
MNHNKYDMLIDGNDFITLANITECADKIDEYSVGMDLDEYDNRRVDAILYNLVKIANLTKFIKEEFLNRYSDVDWVCFNYNLFLFHQEYDENNIDDIYDVLFEFQENEYVLRKEYSDIQGIGHTIYKEMYTYAESEELFENIMKPNDFIKWINFEGKLYFNIWRNNFEKNNDLEIPSFSIDLKEIIQAWMYIDLNRGKSEQAILKKGIKPTIVEYSISSYKDALDILFLLKFNGEDLSDLVKTYDFELKSKPKKNKKRNSGRRKETKPRYSEEELKRLKEMPSPYKQFLNKKDDALFISDNGSCIRTKSSVRSVRQKF